MSDSTKRLSAPWFSDNELRCKGVNCGCGNQVCLDPVFDLKLAELRVGLGMPMNPTSCCRCLVHNRAVGGAKHSFHIMDDPQWAGLQGTAAIDIAYQTIMYRDKLAKLAWKMGFRIGYNKTFLHLDSAAHHRYLRQSIFKYDSVTAAELQEFKNVITGARL